MTVCKRCSHKLTDHRRVVNGPDYCDICNDSPCGEPDRDPARITPAVIPADVTSTATAKRTTGRETILAKKTANKVARLRRLRGNE